MDRVDRRVLGVDGARRGWVGVIWDGVAAEPVFETSLHGLLDTVDDVDVVAVDMPVELEDRDRRRCDLQARALLGPRRSSLFPAPVAGVLDFDDYPSANAWSKATTGHGLSKQAWFLVPKIREVRTLTTAGWRLFETMPELSFRAMHDDVPLGHAKTTWTGLTARMRLLADHGIVLPEQAGRAGAVAADDMVDAGALAWSAMRIADGRAEHCPSDPGRGVPSIWW